MKKQKNPQAQELNGENLSEISGGVNVETQVTIEKKLTLTPEEETFLGANGFQDPYAPACFDKVIKALEEGGFDTSKSLTIKRKVIN